MTASQELTVGTAIRIGSGLTKVLDWSFVARLVLRPVRIKRG